MDVMGLVVKHEDWRSAIYCDRCGQELHKRWGLPGAWVCGKHCAGGNLTIGYGTNLSDGISKSEGLSLLRARLQDASNDLHSFSWFAELDYVRQAALIDMRYTMGAGRFRLFDRMLAALARHDLAAAAAAMLDSTWARSEAPERAADDAALLESGTWQ